MNVGNVSQTRNGQERATLLPAIFTAEEKLCCQQNSKKSARSLQFSQLLFCEQDRNAGRKRSKTRTADCMYATCCYTIALTGFTGRRSRIGWRLGRRRGRITSAGWRIRGIGTRHHGRRSFAFFEAFETKANTAQHLSTSKKNGWRRTTPEMASGGAQPRSIAPEARTYALRLAWPSTVQRKPP